MKTITGLLIVCLTAVFISCEEDDVVYSPKPRGYSRIDFPKREYKMYDSTGCPYKFEIPVYSQVKKATEAADPCSFNLEFPRFKATLHMGYRPVNNNIAQYLDDSHYFANRHQVKATALDEVVILRDSAKVYGLLFDIGGNTASSLQFYITDSTRHFLRGALYFRSIPNIDSLKVVIDFLKEDVLHMINTAGWKKN